MSSCISTDQEKCWQGVSKKQRKTGGWKICTDPKSPSTNSVSPKKKEKGKLITSIQIKQNPSA